jgi:hypothetical protein
LEEKYKGCSAWVESVGYFNGGVINQAACACLLYTTIATAAVVQRTTRVSTIIIVGLKQIAQVGATHFKRFLYIAVIEIQVHKYKQN